MSSLSHFLDVCRMRPDATALIQGTRHITYAELAATSDQYARRLSGAGLGQGDRVVVLIPMCMDLYVWLVALMRLDAVVMFVEPWMPLDLIAACCEKAQPKAMLASPLGVVLAERVPAFRRIPVKLATFGGALLGWRGWHTPVKEGPRPGTPLSTPDDAAVLTFTTGSSGIPKSVVRTHGLLFAQHQILSRSLRLTPDDVCMHVFANFILNNLALGAASIIPNIAASKPTRFRPSQWVEQIRTSRVTSLICPPASLDRLVTYASVHGVTLPSVTKVATGGGVVSRDLLERAARVFPESDPEVLYGSSEVEPVSHLRLSELKELSGDGVCVGRPVEEVKLQLLEHGEIAVSGPHVSRAYLDDAAATQASKFVDGEGVTWHRMGDTAQLDDSGRLWLTGRVSTIIHTSKGPVFPTIVEQRAGRVELVRACAAVGAGNPAQVVLAVEPRTWTPAEFKRWEQQLRHAVPEVERVVFLRSIPTDRRHQSKIDHAALETRISATAAP